MSDYAVLIQPCRYESGILQGFAQAIHSTAVQVGKGVAAFRQAAIKYAINLQIAGFNFTHQASIIEFITADRRIETRAIFSLQNVISVDYIH